MAGFRESFIKKAVAISGGLSTQRLLRWTGQDQLLPFYHAISDVPLSHIQHLYSVKNSQQFRKDLDQMLRIFRPVDLLEFQQIQLEKIKLKQPIFHLSFDDGLSQFHDVIAPILLEKGIPASCFLNAAFVDNQDLFFRYKASLLIDRIKHTKNLEKEGTVIEWHQQLDTAVSLVQSILNIRYGKRSVLDDLAKRIEYDFDEFLKNENPYLSSPQIKKLMTDGFHFGAHSVDHPEYRFLSLEEQLTQTKNSIDWVAQTFDLNYQAFSFPFTDYQVSQAFFDQIAVKNSSVITFGGAGQKHENIAFHFQRMPLEIEKLDASEIINAELLYYLLKAPFGKNRIHRQ